MKSHRRVGEKMTKAIWPTSCAGSDDYEGIRTVLASSGFTIFELADANVTNIETFFRAVVGAVPNDPPLSGRPNLDAFVDSVWECFQQLGVARIAVLWKHADKMLNGGLQDLIIICDLFQEIARTLTTTCEGRTSPVIFHLILFGNGPNFPRIRLFLNEGNLTAEQ
jgi:hypothetical protein